MRPDAKADVDEQGSDKNILQGLYSMNFRKPSKIQEKALPLLLADPPLNVRSRVFLYACGANTVGR